MEIQHRLELMRLLSAQCDGQLGGSEHTRLEELLSIDGEARRIYLQYVDMHARLLVHPGVLEASLPSDGRGRVEPETEPVLARLAVTRRSAAERLEPRWRRIVRQAAPYLGVMAATVAATLLVQVVISRWHPSSDVTINVAKVDAEPQMYVATI